MTDPDVLDLDITGVAHGGVFVGRHEGRVVFVPDTMPGERVRVRITDTRSSSFWRGEVTEVLEPSPDRQAHIWPEAELGAPREDRPGGADFGHIRLDRQRELKRTVVSDALQRIGKVDGDVTIEAPVREDELAPRGLHWRTRVSLHVDEDGTVGPRAARSHRIVPVRSLPLASAEINDAFHRLQSPTPGRVEIVHSSTGEVRVFAPGPAAAATPGITETVAGRSFSLAAGGFWQVHKAAAETLTRAVTEALSPRALDSSGRHLDLYGGVGLFAAALADAAGGDARVTSVESSRRATDSARKNLAGIPGAHAETGRVESWLAALRGSATASDRAELGRGVVLLDPPRAGAGTDVVRAIAEFSPERVVYVACDPAALARDLGAFAAHGYTTDIVRAIDLFPHTHHVEAVTVLERSEGR